MTWATRKSSEICSISGSVSGSIRVLRFKISTASLVLAIGRLILKAVSGRGLFAFVDSHRSKINLACGDRFRLRETACQHRYVNKPMMMLVSRRYLPFIGVNPLAGFLDILLHLQQFVVRNR